MSKSIEERFQAIETQLKQLRKELENDLAKYRDSGYLIKRKEKLDQIRKERRIRDERSRLKGVYCAG